MNKPRTVDPLREAVLLRDDRCCVLCGAREGDEIKVARMVRLHNGDGKLTRAVGRDDVARIMRLFVRQVYPGKRTAETCVTLCSRHHGRASVQAFTRRTGMSLGAWRKQIVREVADEREFTAELRAFSGLNRPEDELL